MSREKEIEALYRSGLSMAKIGRKFGVSGERVRQILRSCGVSSEQGGAILKRREKKSAMEKARRETTSRRFGCTIEQLRYLRTLDDDYHKTPIGQYLSQRSGARRRGIGWNLTLWEWWCIWRDSGLWCRRGRNSGEYVMSRYADKGPYEVGNVEIRLCNENNAQNRHNVGVVKSPWAVGAMNRWRNPLDELIAEDEEIGACA